MLNEEEIHEPKGNIYEMETFPELRKTTAIIFFWKDRILGVYKITDLRLVFWGPNNYALLWVFSAVN